MRQGDVVTPFNQSGGDWQLINLDSSVERLFPPSFQTCLAGCAQESAGSRSVRRRNLHAAKRASRSRFKGF